MIVHRRKKLMNLKVYTRDRRDAGHGNRLNCDVYFLLWKSFLSLSHTHTNTCSSNAAFADSLSSILFYVNEFLQDVFSHRWLVRHSRRSRKISCQTKNILKETKTFFCADSRQQKKTNKQSKILDSFRWRMKFFSLFLSTHFVSTKFFFSVTFFSLLVDEKKIFSPDLTNELFFGFAHFLFFVDDGKWRSDNFDVFLVCDKANFNWILCRRQMKWKWLDVCNV